MTLILPADESPSESARDTIAELTVLVKTRLKRMQYRPGLLLGFLASTELDLSPV